MNENDENEVVQPLPEFNGDMLQQVKSVEEMKAGLGMPTVQIKAAELIGERFIIRRARAFVSSYQMGHTAYYCECVKVDDGEVFSTVLGGQGVVDLLDLYIGSGATSPLEVTLKLVKGGRFGKYYVLE